MLNLVIHSIKNKKNWFLLNLVMTVIITIVMPILFRSGYEFFSVFTMFLTASLILISNFIEFSFLHDERKISYYLSKPISLIEKTNISLISNIVFSTVVFVLTYVIAGLAGSILSNTSYFTFINRNFDIMQPMYAWIIMLTFVIGLSSVLTGSHTVSVFVTIFNFSLPLILFLIIIYMCNILDNTVVGINTEIMVNSFLERYLPLNKLYFFDYAYENLDLFFFIRLLVYCCVAYIFTILAVKTRKNERTGDSIVHSGFKYFMALFASLIAPMFVTSGMRNNDLFSLVSVLVLLSALAYYIMISALNRSFKISKQALKIYVPFILILLISIIIGFNVLNLRASVVPDISDVKAVYIGNSSSYLKDAKLLKPTQYKWESLSRASYEEIKDNDSLILLSEKENVKKVMNLQKFLIKEKHKDYGFQLTIMYYLNNGKKIVRTYDVPYSYSEDYDNSEKINSYFSHIMELARSEEFIQQKFKVFSDENYINNVKFNEIYGYDSNGYINFPDFNFSEFAKIFMEDYRNFISDEDNAMKIHTNIILDIRGFDLIRKEYSPEAREKDEKNSIYFSPVIEDGISPNHVYIDVKFDKTRKYIDSLKKD